jgi:hypothetical protein
MRMTRLAARNALLVIGVWEASSLVAMLFRVLSIPIGNRLIFTGDAGNVAMWLWEGFPDYLVAPLAAITLDWKIETRKPFPWVGILAALYLYGGVLRTWRILTHGWHLPQRTPDYIGIVMQGIIPALVCLVVGVWWTRRPAALRPTAS